MKIRDCLLARASVPLFLRAQGEDGFVSVFDGKKLKGGPETASFVDDGAIAIQESEGFLAGLAGDAGPVA